MKNHKSAMALSAVIIWASLPVQAADLAAGAAGEAAFAHQMAIGHKAVSEGVSGISWDGQKELGPDSPWDEIVRRHRVRWPQVGIRESYFAVSGLCVDGSSLRAVNPPSSICVERDIWGHCSRTIPVDPKYYSRPIESETEVCVHRLPVSPSVCLEARIEKVQIPLSYQVEVLGDHRGGVYNREVLFRKDYTIPACN